MSAAFLGKIPVPLRNLLLLIFILVLCICGLNIGGIKDFYNEKAFWKCAEFSMETEDFEYAREPHTICTVSLEKLSKSYQYKAAVIDLSKIDRPEGINGNLYVDVMLNLDAITGKHQLTYLLILNPLDDIVVIDGFSPKTPIIYTDSENVRANNGCEICTASDFYEVMEEFERTHTSVISMLANDSDHVFYNLFTGKEILWIAVLAVCFIMLVYKAKKTGRKLIFDDDTEEQTKITLMFFGGLALTLFSGITLAVIGAELNDGGIPGILFVILNVVNYVGWGVTFIGILLPYIFERDLLFGFVRLVCKIVLGALIIMAGAGIGLVLIEVKDYYYKAVVTILSIVTLIFCGWLFTVIFGVIGSIIPGVSALAAAANASSEASAKAGMSAGTDTSAEIPPIGLPDVICDISDMTWHKLFSKGESVVYENKYGAQIELKNIRILGNSAKTSEGYFYWD